jgi:hypothetical protein
MHGMSSPARSLDQLNHAMPNTTFPVGFHQLHADVSMNFQMNRWFSWAG